METNPGTTRKTLGDLVAIAMVSASVLMLQVTYTRILSVVVWYHMAFLSVSLALLGLGAPGCWFALRPPKEGTLGRVLLLSAVFIPCSVAALLHGGTPQSDSMIWLVIASLLPPFLLLGSGVVLLLMRAPRALLGTYYAADLAGAAVGAGSVVPLLRLLPTPHLVAAVSLLPLAAAAFFGGRLLRGCAAGAAGLLAASLVWGVPYRISYTKAYDEAGSRNTPVYEKWTPTARLAIFPPGFTLVSSAAAMWGTGSKYVPAREPKYWLEQDGSAGTPISRFDGNLAAVEYLLFDVSSVGYQVRPPTTVAVVGPGGGRDILTALLARARDIDAIELNDGIILALEGPFREFSGDVYHRPGVHAIASEGRSYLSRTQKTYDMIQISMIDSWAATAAGAYALSENNLYTVEAVEQYLARLNQSGLLSATRWARGWDFFETTRFVVIAKEALARAGVRRAADHIVVVRANNVATVLVSRSPFGAADFEALRRACDLRGFTVLHPPLPPEKKSNAIAVALVSGVEGLTQATGFDYSPTTDDRPFFFFARPVFDLESDAKESVSIRWAVGVTSYLALLLFLLPFTRWRFPDRRELGRSTAYFSAIGIGFMLIEAPMIQRFVLYLGHPSYATTVVLSSILLGAGVGALRSTNPERSRWPLLATLVFLPLMNLGMSAAFRATIGEPLAFRIALSFVVLAFCGFLLGHWLPLGMGRFSDANRPWFWAINGVMSVLATTVSVALAIAFGFTAVALLGAAVYVVAWFLLRAPGGQGASSAA